MKIQKKSIFFNLHPAQNKREARFGRFLAAHEAIDITDDAIELKQWSLLDHIRN